MTRITQVRWDVQPSAGQNQVDVAIRIADAKGRALTKDKFGDAHEMAGMKPIPMHLVAVNKQTLTIVDHEHPKFKAGAFHSKLFLAPEGAEVMFAEYDVKGQAPSTARHEVVVTDE